MKIASQLIETSFKKEERKRFIQRKEIAQAYKKNTSYIEVSKNPMLKAIKDLLSSKETSPNEKFEILKNVDLNSSQVESEIASSREFHNEEEFNIEPFSSDYLKNELREFLEYEYQSFSDIAGIYVEHPLINLNGYKVLRESIEYDNTQATYQKAISKYTFQMNMVANGFTLVPSQISFTA